MKERKGFWGLFGFISISQKITLGFIAIYIFFIANAINTTITVLNGAERIEEFSEVVNPAIDKIDDFRQMVVESQLYTFIWVQQGSDKRTEDRKALQKIHLDFPEFKDNLIQLMKNWREDDLNNNEKLSVQIDSAINQFERIIEAQRTIIEKLPNNEDFVFNQFDAEKILENQVIPPSKQLLEKLNQLSLQKKKVRVTQQARLLDNFNNLIFVIFTAALVLIFMGFLVSWWTRRQIVRPIKYINSVFVRLGSGVLPDDKHFPFNNDEIGEMAASADKLIYNLKETSQFAQKIGRGEYDASYTPLSDEDMLGTALLEMRNNLAEASEKERKRKWSTEGQVLFSEILKENTEHIPEISDKVISEMVKYLKANQGALFVVEQPEQGFNGNGTDPYLSMAACYAWDKKKFLEQKIYLGDGLVGQAWQEKGTIYLDEVPQGYVMITSGLGEANPKSVLIVPLIHNEEVFGVIEIASFQEFQEYEIEFVEKITESIAATIASVRINERTRYLLSESTMMTEQMKSQEEEMRQNMEELEAAQESIERSQREAKAKETLLESNSIVLQTGRDFVIQSFNDFSEHKLHFTAAEFEQMSIEFLFLEYAKIETGMEILKAGNTWIDFVYLKNKHNQKIFVKVIASPIRNEMGEMDRYLFIMDDITDAKS